MKRVSEQKGILYEIEKDLYNDLWLRAIDIELRLSLGLLLTRHAQFQALYGP